VKKGKKVTLSGTVSSTTACTAGPVVLQGMPKGKKEFAAVAETTSASNGTFAAKVKVKKTTQFRATVAATSACAAAESAAAKVKAKRKKKRGH